MVAGPKGLETCSGSTASILFFLQAFASQIRELTEANDRMGGMFSLGSIPGESLTAMSRSNS